MTDRSSCVPIQDQTLQNLQEVLFVNCIGDAELDEVLQSQEKTRMVICCILDITHSVDRTKGEILEMLRKESLPAGVVQDRLAAQGFPESTIEKALGKLKLISRIREQEGALVISGP